jgi:hypothetical protein
MRHDLASFEQASDEDQHSGSGKSRGDEFKVAEQLLDLGLLCAVEQGLFYDLLDRFSYDSGKQRGPDHENGKLLKRGVLEK